MVARRVSRVGNTGGTAGMQWYSGDAVVQQCYSGDAVVQQCYSGYGSVIVGYGSVTVVLRQCYSVWYG